MMIRKLFLLKLNAFNRNSCDSPADSHGTQKAFMLRGISFRGPPLSVFIRRYEYTKWTPWRRYLGSPYANQPLSYAGLKGRNGS